MSKNEIVSMIETMNNYDELASKAKAKADAIQRRAERRNAAAGYRRTERGRLHRALYQRHFQPL